MTFESVHPPRAGGPAHHGPSTGGQTQKHRPTEIWRDAALCSSPGIDPALFHGTPAQLREARAICRRCPVGEACLWSTMVAEAESGYRFGVWGACLPSQRDLIASVLGHAPAEFQRRLQAASEAHLAAKVGERATDAA